MPRQLPRSLKWGFAGLSAGSSPLRLHPRSHRLLRSPHERLGSRAVDPTRFPSHLAPLGSPLDFHQRDGEGLVVDLVSDRVPIPEEERVGHARGEGDLQHLPGLRVSHLLPVTIYYHISGDMSTPFLKFLKKNWLRFVPRSNGFIKPLQELRGATHRKPV